MCCVWQKSRKAEDCSAGMSVGGASPYPFALKIERQFALMVTPVNFGGAISAIFF